MELPEALMGTVVGEGEKYFFTVDCPIGVQEAHPYLYQTK